MGGNAENGPKQWLGRCLGLWYYFFFFFLFVCILLQLTTFFFTDTSVTYKDIITNYFFFLQIQALPMKTGMGMGGEVENGPK